MTAEAEKAKRLIEHALAALNEADPVRLVSILSDADDPTDDPELRVDPKQEYRLEAEAIARGIRHEELGRGMLDEEEIARIVSSVIEHWFDQRITDREAREIAEGILARRLGDS